MDEQSDKEIAGKKQRDRILELVSKGFYNELINYGVRKDEIRPAGRANENCGLRPLRHK
jgi:hypothetical protein